MAKKVRNNKENNEKIWGFVAKIVAITNWDENRKEKYEIADTDNEKCGKRR
jgi:hypothetical protein